MYQQLKVVQYAMKWIILHEINVVDRHYKNGGNNTLMLKVLANSTVFHDLLHKTLNFYLSSYIFDFLITSFITNR